MIRIVVVDDQELVRTGLRSLAEHDGDIVVIAEAANGATGLQKVREHLPEVVLMDIRMPVMDGLDATAQIMADPALVGVRVLIMTTFDEDENVFDAIRLGAAGYLLKDIASTELRRAIRVVAGGDAQLSPAITRKVMQSVAGRHRPPDEGPIVGLTEREREVLTEIGRGLSNQEISQKLFISHATARTYVSRLLAKLNARDRSQLVILAYESGLVTPGRS